jgi:hypothetical protein
MFALPRPGQVQPTFGTGAEEARPQHLFCATTSGDAGGVGCRSNQRTMARRAAATASSRGLGPCALGGAFLEYLVFPIEIGSCVLFLVIHSFPPRNRRNGHGAVKVVISNLDHRLRTSSGTPSADVWAASLLKSSSGIGIVDVVAAGALW